MTISFRHWLLALIGAVLIHALAGTLVWALQNVPARLDNRAQQGVMVSLDTMAPSALATPAQTSDPVTSPSQEPSAGNRTPDNSALQPVTPAAAAATATTPDIPDIVTPPAPDSPAAGSSASALDIPVAETVTISSTVAEDMPFDVLADETKATDVSPDATAMDSQGHGGGTPTDIYINRIQAWLGSHQHYPEQARRNKEEGIVNLYLVIDQDGRVLVARVAQSSGSDELDEAALAMVERTESLPPMPENMQRTRLEVIFPVRFRLDEETRTN